MEHITDWGTREIGRAGIEGRVEMLSCSRDEALWLVDNIPESEPVDDLAQYLDQARGDCTDGKPRYLILKIGESVGGGDF